jgi:hypothetical protein
MGESNANSIAISKGFSWFLRIMGIALTSFSAWVGGMYFSEHLPEALIIPVVMGSLLCGIWLSMDLFIASAWRESSKEEEKVSHVVGPHKPLSKNWKSSVRKIPHGKKRKETN